VHDEIPEVELISEDLTDLPSRIAAVEHVRPGDVYNLGAVSFVKLPFTQIAGVVAPITPSRPDLLTLANIDTYRDFGYAGDYFEATWRMPPQDQPGEHVIATGRTWTIRQVLDLAFAAVGIDARVPVSLPMHACTAQPTTEFPEVLHEMVRNDIEFEQARATPRRTKRT
jgi:GDP-D-mannose dehydratase